MKPENLLFEEDLEKALETMRKGGIILYPTDTIWGIGCDARNPDAVKKIYALKKRSDEKAMLVLVDSIETLEKTVEQIPEVAFELLEAATTPLTVIYDSPNGIAANLVGKDNTLGIRITNEKFSKELCRRLGAPLVSTSANISGTSSAKNFPEIQEEIKKGVDYIVKYRQDDIKDVTPSHIIKLSSDGQFKILR